ncbi:MAG: hypothetical protein KC438_14005, partial [Thermomicrobiales bacterium]|nr:hypothetical protein [Thermomicrobiales bacterium]
GAAFSSFFCSFNVRSSSRISRSNPTYLMTPDELLDRLDQRLLMLTGAARDFPARQQTMRDALAWSYDLLEPEEQMVLRRLAVFVGSWSLDAAAEICWDLSVDRDARNSANLPVIESLVQKSLVFRSSHLGQPAPDGATRFRLLETVREFADVELFRTDELELIRERHTAYYASAAARLECIAWGDEPGDSRAILAAEYGNFHAALLWAIEREQTELAFQIVAAVFNPEATQDLSRILGQDTHSQLEFVR